MISLCASPDLPRRPGNHMLRKGVRIPERCFLAIGLKKAFLIGLVVAPLFFGGSVFGIALLRVTQGNTERRVAVVDHTGMAADAILEAAREKSEREKAGKSGPQLLASRYVFETVPPDERDAAG